MSGAPVGTPALATGTTSLAPSWSGDQPRTTGHTLFAVVMVQNAGTVTPTCSQTSGGFTQDSTFAYAPGTGAEGACWIWRKTAAGADAAPAFTCSGGTGAGSKVYLLEVSGLDTTTPVDTVFTPGSGATSGTPLACGASALATSAAWVLSVAGGRGTATNTWSSPLTALINTTGSSGWLAVATAQLASAASITPTDTPTSTVNASVILAVAYRTVVADAVTVTNPGSQTNTVGSAITPLAVAASDTQGHTLTYSASGLPTGLSINSSTGSITGTPTTAGTYSSATVTATCTGSQSDSKTFTWTIATAGTTRKVRVSGTATAVSARKVRVAGTATTAARKVRVAGVAT